MTKKSKSGEAPARGSRLERDASERPSRRRAPQGERDYTVRRDGWVAGRRVRAGETVRLTPRAARYEPVEPVGEAADGGQVSAR